MARLKRVELEAIVTPIVRVPNRVGWMAWINAPEGSDRATVFAEVEAEWLRRNHLGETS